MSVTEYFLKYCIDKFIYDLLKLNIKILSKNNKKLCKRNDG